MAIYHLHVKNISRRDNRSAVAAAAYRAGETLPNEAEEKDSAFAGKRDVIFTEIRLPPAAPAWMSDRGKLWNAVEAAEQRKDARLAKEVEFSLPRELSPSAWIDAAREMADAYVKQGHVVDIAIHEDGGGHNPHVHLLLATRAVAADGFKLKLREADGVAFVTEARKTWARIANSALGKAGAGVEIDARSNAARGIEKSPTTHRGPDPAARRARRWGKEMNHDMLEARRELLSEQGNRERFPLLAVRPDWPPERREPVPGLTPAEAVEWKTFWREVDKRMWGEELRPLPADEMPTDMVATRDPVQIGRLLDGLTKVARDSAAREANLENALPVWRDLHAAVVERMRAAGHRTDDPLSDWTRVQKSLRDFEAQLTELRRQDAERRAWKPVPDPDGRSISALELEEAQERLVADDQRPVPQADVTPGLERLPEAGRAAARAAVDRQNRIDVPDRDAGAYRLAPHESRLDWLDGVSASRSPDQQRDDRLDWLEPGPDQERKTEPERDRDR